MSEFSAKIYHFPGSHLDQLPENVLQYLEKEFDFSRTEEDNDGIPDVLKDHSALIVELNGEIIQCRLDGGEPEDQTFGRDLSWVPNVIWQAYLLGAGKA